MIVGHHLTRLGEGYGNRTRMAKDQGTRRRQTFTVSTTAHSEVQAYLLTACDTEGAAMHCTDRRRGASDTKQRPLSRTGDHRITPSTRNGGTEVGEPRLDWRRTRERQPIVYGAHILRRAKDLWTPFVTAYMPSTPTSNPPHPSLPHLPQPPLHQLHPVPRTLLS